MRRSVCHLAGVLALFASLLSPSLAGGGGNTWAIPIQTELKTAAGAPINGSAQIVFTLYTVPTGGTAFWTESRTVTVTKGLLSTSLGQVTPLPEPLLEPLYLGIKVGSDPELTPRLFLTAVPYSLRLPNVYPLAGMLGIGTPLPGATLDVVASDQATLRLHSVNGSAPTIRLNRSAASGFAPGSLGRLDFSLNGSAWGGVGANFATAADDGLFFNANYEQVARLQWPGLFELKSSVGEKLVLYRASDGISTVGMGVQGNLLQVHSDVSMSDIAFGYGSSDNLTETVRFSHLGRVGIGTKTPAYPLDIASPGQAVIRMQSAAAPTGSVLELRNNTASPSSIGAINFVNAAGSYSGQIAYSGDNSLTFRTNGDESARITSDGRFGIGTAAPRARLEVIANPGSGNSDGIRITNTFGGYGIHFVEEGLGSDGPGIDVDSSRRLFLTNRCQILIGRAYLQDDGTWTTTSDARLKNDVRPETNLLQKALLLKPVNFVLKGDDRSHQGERRLGLVAQDVESLFPSLVAQGEYKSLNYAGMSVVAIGALQEYAANNDAAMERLRSDKDAEIGALRKANANLESRLARLERLVEAGTVAN